MIRINLLPYREHRRQASQRQFYVMAGAAAAIALATVILIHTFNANRLQNQATRNEYLNTEIAVLDKKISEIKTLQEQIQALLARKQVVETLQSSRSDVVHLLDQLARVLPEGVYLTSVKQTDRVVALEGYAQTNARVASLLRNLASSPWLSQPTLLHS
ncbi:MAG: PilN domain-containing protein, partial [Burkholderiales bacterium]